MTKDGVTVETVERAVETPTRSLHRKLAEVMAEVERIPKNGTAPAILGGFKFVQVGDAADAIRKALGSRCVSMLPTTVEIVGQTEHVTKTGLTMTTAELRITWTLTDGESGETATIQSYGVGADTGDKYSGKATSNAMKYALLAGFLLSTGEDVELTDTSDRRARRTAAENLQGRPQPDAPPDPPAFNAVAATHRDGLIGVAEKTKDAPEFGEMRQGPDGHVLAFRLVEGRRAVKVVAVGIMAELIHEYRAGIEGFRVTLWGTVEDEPPWTPTGSTRPVVVQHVLLERLKVGPLDLSAPDVDEEAEPPDLVAAATELFPDAVMA